MRITGIAYKVADYQADLADIDAAIASASASRCLAARREVDNMLRGAALTGEQRSEVKLRIPRLKQVARSASIT